MSFSKSEIALAEAARAISAFWKTNSCKLIPNWTRNRMITKTNYTIYTSHTCTALQHDTKKDLKKYETTYYTILMLLRKILVLQYNYLQIDIVKNYKNNILHDITWHYVTVQYDTSVTWHVISIRYDSISKKEIKLEYSLI